MHTLAKKFASVVKTGVPALLMAGLLFSCSKESFNTGVKQDKIQVTDKAVQKQIMAQAHKMPAVGIYNKTMNKVIVFRHFEDGRKSFSFTNPPGNGINFATSNGGQWVWTEEGGLVILSEPSQGLGGGGTVVAGNTTLDIAIAFCFSFDEEALGADLFDTGLGQVAGVIGIAGDFEALANGDFDEDDDLFEYFHGFAYYLVYAEQLGNQNYEVLNWIEDLEQDEEDLEDFGFAFVVAFQGEGGIYLSKDGNLSVSGGSIGFNGNYYGIEGLGWFDGEDGDVNFVEVPGFGVMGCD
jgi:hypothetical protein